MKTMARFIWREIVWIFAFALLLAPDFASGQTSNGRATTVAPTYTNGQTAPLSLDTTGNLRTNCVSGCAGGSFNNNADNVATSATNGQSASWSYVWDGATWDRLYGDSTNGAFTNLKALGGTAVDTNSGTKSAGTLRVVLATDQPALTNKLLVTPDSVALPANQSVNVAQINGVTPLMGAGNTGTGSHRVTISTDDLAHATWGHGATGAAVPANATMAGVSKATGATLAAIAADPCMTTARTYATINIASATTTRIVAPSASNRTYICGLLLYPGAANNIAIVEGTGGTCGAATAGVIGGTTAATGILATATAGFALPVTGYAQAATAGTNVDLCLITSGAGQVSGNIAYVQQP